MGCSASTEVRAVSPDFNAMQRAENQNNPGPAPGPQHNTHTNQHYHHQNENKSNTNHNNSQQYHDPPLAYSHVQQNQAPQHVEPNIAEPLSEKTPMNDSKPYLKIRAPDKPLNPNSGLAVDMNHFEGLESKIAKSNAILNEESIENMHHRLATYGVYAESYSARELNEHNNEKGFVDLLSFHNDAVSMPALFDLCSPYTFAIERKKLLECNPDLEESDYPSCWEHHHFQSPFSGPFLDLLCDGIDCKTIVLCMKKCRVSKIRKDKKEEIADLKQDINVVMEEISRNAEELGESLLEYKDQLQRACAKYNVTLASTGEIEETKVSAEDLNEKVFPLPDVFQKNPKLFRKWVETWEIFDTKGNGWDFSLKQWELFEKDSSEMKIDDTKLHRTELDTLPPLDLSIDGEAGWDVIPVDIVKNDITTPQQEKTWRIRDKRTDLNDPVQMEKRRMAIEEYFQRMYAERFTWASKRVAEFRGFADNLLKGEQDFLELCEKS